MLHSLAKVSSRTARAGQYTYQPGCQPLTYFKRLRSETEIQSTKIEKTTMTDKPCVFLQFQV